MKAFLILIFFVIDVVVKSQTSYSGFIDKSPIQLLTYIYSDGDVRAVYEYDKFDTPIKIDGHKSGKKLELLEHNEKNELLATLSFSSFDENSPTLNGTWISKDSLKRFKISLKRNFDIDKDKDFEQREIIQSCSTKDHYFKLLITKTGGNARVTGVKILEKRTDRLIQSISLDCQLWGLENISVGDYNFDGIDDFSVFESSYAGPNTSSIYILRKANSEEYFVSDFSGTSLEFDSASKTISEHNQSSAGRSQMNATYKVVNNKMVLISRTCLEYDDEKADFVKKECE